MKNLVLTTALLLITALSFNCTAQLVQFGIRTQADVQSVNFPLHNISAGCELDVNIPVVGFGVSASAMVSLRYLENKAPGVLDNMYEYIYLPLNLKWRIGPKVFRIIIAAGPYALVPAGTKIKKEINLQSIMDASLWGMNLQLGFEFLKHYRFSVGYRSDAFQSDLEDLINHAHGFYADFFYSF